VSSTAIPRLGRSGTGAAPRRGRGTALRAAVLLLTAALVLGACSTGSDSATDPSAAQPEQVAPGEGSSDATRQDAADGGGTTAGPVSPTLSAPVADRSVVYTVGLVVRVDDVPTAAADAADVAAAYDGYVQSESSYGSDAPRPVEPLPYDPAVVLPPAGQGQAVVVIRVPADRYEDAVADLEALGQTVSRSRDAQDVTDEVVDVEARIETQQAAIARLEQLLAEATTVSDVLAVEAQLTTRVAELESLQARQQQLGDLTALATITATFVPPEAVVDEGTGFVAGLQAGWRAFLRTVELGLTAVGALLPFALFFALLLVPLVVWLVLHSRRRRRSRADAVGAPAAPPQ
jgi:hypothetical protein